LGEHLLCKQEVTGSIPVVSTRHIVDVKLGGVPAAPEAPSNLTVRDREQADIDNCIAIE
jgi:hypothetical protein